MRFCGRMLLLGCVLFMAVCTAVYAEDNGEPLTLEAGEDYCFQKISLLAHIPDKGNFWYLQGGGRDERYAYYAMIDNAQYALLFKYDLETWKRVDVSKPLPLYHANDITYDAETNLLWICPIGKNEIMTVDPDTLTLKGSFPTRINLHRIAAFPAGQGWAAASYYTYLLYGQNETSVYYNAFSCQGNRHVTQGMTTDGRYLYDLRWDADHYSEWEVFEKSNVCDFVVVHDLEGRFIGNIPVYGLRGEPENIIWLGGSYFAVGCNNTNNIYLTELVKQSD